MDRNQVIGLVLIAGILITYSIIFKPDIQEQPIATSDSTQVVEPQYEQLVEAQVVEMTAEDSAVALSSQYGIFGAAMTGANKETIIETDLVKYTFSSKGGQVTRVELNEYLTYDKQPLVLFDKSSSDLDMIVSTTNGNVNLADLNFETATTSRTIASEDSLSISFIARLGGGNSVEQIYKIKADNYAVDYELKINGLNQNIIGDEITIDWKKSMKRFEQNLEDSRNKSTVRYYTLAEEYDELKEMTTDPQSETLNEGIKWVAFSQKFFNAGIISENGFSRGQFNTVPGIDTTVVKDASIALAIPLEQAYAGAEMKYYFGPNNYKVLKKVTDEYEKNVYMGYAAVSWVNKLIIVNLFGWLEGSIANYGLIILIIVIIVKGALFPLTRKSYLSMAKMKVLKPELDELKEKFSDDPQKMQQEQMALYRQFGANPFQGCLPMVLQMPILFAMFFFFPNSIELRQQSFLWAHDLSTYDVLINLPFTIPFYGAHVSGFTLLMTISTILYTWSNNQVSSVQGPMKSIGYVMPIIFMFVLNSYSSGLSFYYFCSNIITFGQQALIRRFVDDEKIRAKLEENKKKNANKKKSKFQARLEEAMKASQEAQKQKQAQTKKKKK